MGLAEPKRRKKLLPSNNAPSTWSKAAPDSSIGFKLMAGMGWAPGSGLGSDLQGQKNNVKYSLKDDLLGVGAKKEYGGGVWRGMGEVDDLYKRLDVGNGSKSEDGANVTETKVEIVEREEVKIRGGWQMRFQVGDVYTSSFSRDESEATGTSGASTPAVTESQSGDGEKKKSKKRKREEDKEKKSKKSKKEKSPDKQEEKSKKVKKEKSRDIKEVEEEKPKKEKTKKDKTKTPEAVATEPEKLKRRKSEKGIATKQKELPTETKPETNGITPTTSESKKDKKEKKDKSSSKPAKESKTSSSKKDKKKDKSSKSTDSDTTASIPVATSVTIITETVVAPPEIDRTSPIPRHMHRSRYLAMKRAATMDKNALREILGVKG